MWGMNGGQPESPDGKLLVYARKPSLVENVTEIWICDRDTLANQKKVYTVSCGNHNGPSATFVDNDHIVFMLSPTDEASLRRLCDLLLSIERRESIDLSPPAIPRGACAVSMHDALYLEGEVIDAKDSLDRVFASFNVACPPAVPCVTLGERIGIDAIKCFEYYGIEKIRVLKDKNI